MTEDGKVGNSEIYNLLVSRELSWQQMIYDLIQSEQLDPWDIDLSILTQRYLEKIREFEDANFFISSKVLLAAAILLRIKSELLLKYYIKSLDEILFGKEEPREKLPLNINLDDVTDLMPRTPLPRMKKVTLQELMSALNRAIMTEHRRIKREIYTKHAVTRFDAFLPKRKTNIRLKIREIYQKIIRFFSKDSDQKMTYSMLTNNSREEKLNSFMPILHLDSQEKIMLEQLHHFDEIYIYLKSRTVSQEDFSNQLTEQEKKIDAMKNMDGFVEEDMNESNEEGLNPEKVGDFDRV
jgi:segregation and condensation protein A